MHGTGGSGFSMFGDASNLVMQSVALHCTVSLQDRYHLVKNNCEHLVTYAMSGFPISVQVDEKFRQFLITSRESATTLATIFGNIATSGSGSTVIRLGITGVVRISLLGAEDIAESATTGTFQLGVRAVLNSTAVGLAAAGGVAFIVSALCEGAIFTRAVYKLTRKKKFNKISDAEYKRELIKNGSRAVGSVVGGVGGAVAGQVAIPVPILGAVVGMILGTAGGMAAGYGVGQLISKSMADERITELPPAIYITVVEMDPD